MVGFEEGYKFFVDNSSAIVGAEMSGSYVGTVDEEIKKLINDLNSPIGILVRGSLLPVSRGHPSHRQQHADQENQNREQHFLSFIYHLFIPFLFQFPTHILRINNTLLPDFFMRVNSFTDIFNNNYHFYNLVY